MKNTIDFGIRKNSGIYKILNVLNGKFYIGSTVNLSRRYSSHKCLLKKGTHKGLKLQAAYNKYGGFNFNFILIEICDKDKLLIREQYYLDLFKPEYNIKLEAGSGNHSFCPSPEHREKIRKANLGKKMSDETKELLRQSHLGKKLSKETKLILSKINKGKVLTQETKDKISKSSKGKTKNYKPHTTKLTKDIVVKIKTLLLNHKILEVFEKMKHLSVTHSQIREISANRAWKNINI